MKNKGVGKFEVLFSWGFFQLKINNEELIIGRKF